MLIASLLFAIGCGAPAPEGSTDGDEQKQENICLLLDLSDRIDPTINEESPSHRERDMAAVGAVIEHFTSAMKTQGAFFAEGKLRTLFSPPPAAPRVNEIASSLRIDLKNSEPLEKKKIFDSLASRYNEGLDEIYSEVIESKNYVGADIWRFFAEGQVNDYCIEPSPEYTNTLVIITDGYLYHEASATRINNRTSYVTGPFLAREGLRVPDWRSKFEGGEYGIIPTPIIEGNLRVLVLEINPSEANADDYFILEAFWSDWFEQMGVTNYRLLKTDIPANTRETILRYLSDI